MFPTKEMKGGIGYLQEVVVVVTGFFTLGV